MRFTILALAACVPLCAQIPAQDARNTDVVHTDTHFKPKTYQSLADWTARKAVLRKQILSAAGLMPMFAKNDLRPQVFGRIENRDYSVEKVLLETLPGNYLRVTSTGRSSRARPRASLRCYRRTGTGSTDGSSIRTLHRYRRVRSAWRGRDMSSSRTTCSATTTPFRRRTILATSPLNSFGHSGRSDCSFGIRSGRWISSSRCR